MTPIEIVKLLVFGNKTDATFSDPDIQVFLDQVDQSIFYACALVCDSRAATVGSSLKEVRLGDFTDYSGKNQVAALSEQAARFREWEEGTPAYADVEEGLSQDNYYTIIRNYILRTQPEAEAT